MVPQGPRSQELSPAAGSPTHPRHARLSVHQGLPVLCRCHLWRGNQAGLWRDRAEPIACTVPRPPPLSPPPPRAFMAQGSPAPWEWAAKPQRVLWGLSCPKPRWEQEEGVLLAAPSPCLAKQRGASPPTGAARPSERQQEDAVLPETGNFTSCFCSSHSSGPRDPGLGEAQGPHRHGMWWR